MKSNKLLHNELIGLIPAGGQATRIAPLPCSKELYPIGFQSFGGACGLRPKVVSHYLLEKMQYAGISRAFIILRNGKWDIPAYFGDGGMANIHIAYLIMGLPYGVPYTLDQAYPFIQNANIAFGFPDILFHTESAFIQLMERLYSSNADIVLGLFPTNEPQEKDMVDVNDQGQVLRIEMKPDQTDLLYTWCIAVWTPVFTRFMHEYLAGIQNIHKEGNAVKNIQKRRELSMGHVLQAAIRRNLQEGSVIFLNDTCLDVGTPEDLKKAVQNIR